MDSKTYGQSPTTPCSLRAVRSMRFPVAGHLVTITIEEEPEFLWTAEDIDEIKAFLDIWRKGQARVDRSRPDAGIPASRGTCSTHPSSDFDAELGCRACVLGWPPENDPPENETVLPTEGANG